MPTTENKRTTTEETVHSYTGLMYHALARRLMPHEGVMNETTTSVRSCVFCTRTAREKLRDKLPTIAAFIDRETYLDNNMYC